MTQTNSSYYLWKWADNDLPGKPNEVYSELLHGKMHPALQTFNPAPVIRQLERIAVQGRSAGEEWDWQIHQPPAGRQASFIFLTCPTVGSDGQMRRRFCDLLLYLDISGYDEQRGQLMHCFQPKMNNWECGTDEETAYDITEDDLPVLLRRIQPNSPEDHGVLVNRQNYFVNCAIYGRRFTIEWWESYDLANSRKFGQWRAGYFEGTPGRQRQFVPKQLDHWRVNSNCDWVTQPPSKSVQELMLYRDTLRIFQAFLRGESRPPQYRWQDIKDELP